ncbi:MAG: PhnA domain-containing protein [Robiginitomaculum sp.]
MTIDTALLERANDACELCKTAEKLQVLAVDPQDDEIVVCAVCASQIGGDTPLSSEHFKALSETMWSDEPAVQVMIWRLLTVLQGKSWASEARDMLYLEDDVKTWAEAAPITVTPCVQTALNKDSNGTILEAGDNVTLIKDLAVKGAGFTAKRGTLVQNISLTDNSKHIEGRVNGQQIVLVSAYLKKVV